MTIADFAAGAQGALVADGDPTQLMVNEAVRDALQRAADGVFTRRSQARSTSRRCPKPST